MSFAVWIKGGPSTSRAKRVNPRLCKLKDLVFETGEVLLTVRLVHVHDRGIWCLPREGDVSSVSPRAYYGIPRSCWDTLDIDLEVLEEVR